MSKQIKLKYNNEEYILEYNRKAVATIEALGFNANEITSKPATMTPLIFQGAFIMHHSSMTIDKLNEMLYNIPNRSKLINSLINMINECYQSLLSDDIKDKDNEKNVSWEIM